jgi:hypothetical protein
MGVEKCLLYCIFRTEKPASFGVLSGVDGQPVSVVSNAGLCAAVSEIAQPELAPDIPRITAYKDIVDSFHRNPAVRGIIPMRYGLIFDNESDVLCLLEKKGEQYDALLKELDGCVEMGIRVLISDRCKPIEGSNKKDKVIESETPVSERSGRDYLRARRAHYEQEERFTKETEGVIDQCRNAFSGLFVKCKSETPYSPDPQTATFPVQSLFRLSHSRPSPPAVSLCFLVPRKSLESFRQTFRHMVCRNTWKILLSGPWPPYNFV